MDKSITYISKKCPACGEHTHIDTSKGVNECDCGAKLCWIHGVDSRGREVFEVRLIESSDGSTEA